MLRLFHSPHGRRFIRMSTVSSGVPVVVSSQLRRSLHRSASLPSMVKSATDAVHLAVPAWSQEAIANAAVHSRVVRLVEAYRRWGHLAANTDPLGLVKPLTNLAELSPARYGLSDADTKTAIPTVGIVTFPDGRPTATVSDILVLLKSSYCSDIAFEFEYCVNEEQRRWWSDMAEGAVFAHRTTGDRLKSHFHALKAEQLDLFLGKKFPSFKRYSGEGAEALHPGMEAVFEDAAMLGLSSVVIGMAHRGRLNLLCGSIDYPCRALFKKVKGGNEVPKDYDGTADAVSHLSSSTNRVFGSKSLHITMLHNPSHLEAVDPVVLGKVRARQEKEELASNLARGDGVLPVMIHGDAAFCGQGIVPESFLLANLPSYTVGGTFHLITNNQIGFTTTMPNSRSSLHSSDISKMVNCPVLHVNGDNIDSVVRACRLALAYRQRFKMDVLVNMLCFRRHGHNEIDDPSFTNPVMYTAVRSHASVVALESQRLTAGGLLSKESLEKKVSVINGHLDKEYEATDAYVFPSSIAFAGKWSKYGQPSDMTESVTLPTGVDVARLATVGRASVTLAGAVTEDGTSDTTTIRVHDRLQRHHIDSRFASIETSLSAGASEDAKVLDWATAEAMAVGALLMEGYGTRISGQDVGRGTFSHRHFTLTCQDTEIKVIPLNAVAVEKGKPGTPRLQVCNSPLSELAVMGFEYGYSWEDSDTLPIWEAQFGDFFNGAQIMIDTFLASGEAKWVRQSGLVLLLPHGFDGAGPEHSSCRIERFLQLTGSLNALDTSQAKLNWSIAQPTTPANYFHLLRRQIHRSFRRPLVIATPKILLRHPQARSSLHEMAPGTGFRPVLGDSSVPHGAVLSVIVTSGKMYYDIVAERDNRKRSDVAVVRLEELAPFPSTLLTAAIAAYPKAKQLIWAQQEPQNCGAWSWVAPFLHQICSQSPQSLKLTYAGNPWLAGNAVGCSVLNKVYDKELIDCLWKQL